MAYNTYCLSLSQRGLNYEFQKLRGAPPTDALQRGLGRARRGPRSCVFNTTAVHGQCMRSVDALGAVRGLQGLQTRCPEVPATQRAVCGLPCYARSAGLLAWSPGSADRGLRGLLGAVHSLASSPERGPRSVKSQSSAVRGLDVSNRRGPRSAVQSLDRTPPS